MLNQTQGCAESAGARRWVTRLKTIGKAVLILLAVVVGVRQFLWETYTHIGDLGMDDLGRQVLCQSLYRVPKDVDDIRVRCEGFHRRTFVIAMKHSGPILFGRLKPAELVEDMKRPYEEALVDLTGLYLRGDKQSNQMDRLTPISEIHSKLKALGARTLGDFFAACGFERFLVRDEEQKVNYLEVTFSRDHYGSNPVSIY